MFSLGVVGVVERDFQEEHSVGHECMSTVSLQSVMMAFHWRKDRKIGAGTIIVVL